MVVGYNPVEHGGQGFSTSTCGKNIFPSLDSCRPLGNIQKLDGEPRMENGLYRELRVRTYKLKALAS